MTTETGMLAPAGGWKNAMTAAGHSPHLLDPVDGDSRISTERRTLCGRREVYVTRYPGVDPLEVPQLCRKCRHAAGLYRPLPPVDPIKDGPDPLVRLLQAGGLEESQARAAAGIARGYLSSEVNSALARGELAVQERRLRLATDGLDPGPMRNAGFGIGWAREVVHARRVWPAEKVAGTDQIPGIR